MSKPTIHWRTLWDNGTPTHVVTFSAISGGLQSEAEQVADEEGVIRDGERWQPSKSVNLAILFKRLRALGLRHDFGTKDENAPFNLQRLTLTQETRDRLEMLAAFTLTELAGFCPVQAEGFVDGSYFYFRARGSHWRFELGGNESGTKGAKWWHEEYWPNETGVEAGYLSDEDAIRCILGAVTKYRTEDRGRFEKSHPDFERTTLDGWSIGAISLSRVTRRLGISGHEAVDKARALGIELPYLVDLELKALETKPRTVSVLDEKRGIWAEVAEEDD